MILVWCPARDHFQHRVGLIIHARTRHPKPFGTRTRKDLSLSVQMSVSFHKKVINLEGFVVFSTFSEQEKTIQIVCKPTSCFNSTGRCHVGAPSSGGGMGDRYTVHASISQAVCCEDVSSTSTVTLMSASTSHHAARARPTNRSSTTRVCSQRPQVRLQ